MIKNLLRVVPVIALTALPLLAAGGPAAATTNETEAPIGQAAGGLRAAAAPLYLSEAVRMLPVAEEQRDGYSRDLYKHWNRGLDAGDGCDTRREVLLSEAVVAPEVGAGCKIAGGVWESYYDGVQVTSASGLDVDHMVPLAEAHDSGGHAWSASRREAYANDQASPISLVGVTAKSNRSKSDKDPAEWMPPLSDVHCQYLADWVSTKLRWSLSANTMEREALIRGAGQCAGTEVVYEPAAA